MAEILLRWVNTGIPVSRPASDLEDDFRNGYLLGELLARHNQLPDFELMRDASGPDAAIANYCILAPTLKSLGVHFNANIAADIMAGKPGAASAVLYALKVKFEGMRRSCNPVSMRKLVAGVVPLPVVRDQTSKPLYESLSQRIFAERMRQVVANGNEMQEEKALQRFTLRGLRQLEFEERGKMLDNTAFIERDRVRRVERMHKREQQVALAEATAVEHRLRWIKNQKVAKHRRASQKTFETNASVEKEARRERKRAEAVRELAAGIEAFETSTMARVQSVDLLGAGDQEQQAMVEMFTERRRRKFLSDAQTAQVIEYENMGFSMLQDQLMRDCRADVAWREEATMIHQHVHMFQDNRSFRESQYEARRKVNAEEDKDVDDHVYALVQRRYERNVHRQERVQQLLSQAHEAAEAQRSLQVASSTLEDLINLCVEVAKTREFLGSIVNTSAELLPEAVWRDMVTTFVRNPRGESSLRTLPGALIQQDDDNLLSTSEAGECQDDDDGEVGPNDKEGYNESWLANTVSVRPMDASDAAAEALDEVGVGEYLQRLHEAAWKVPCDGPGILAAPKDFAPENLVKRASATTLLGEVLVAMQAVHEPLPPPPRRSIIPRMPLQVVLLGPTFSGKTSLALRIAERSSLKRICADELLNGAIAYAKAIRQETSNPEHVLAPLNLEMDARMTEEFKRCGFHAIRVLRHGEIVPEEVYISLIGVAILSAGRAMETVEEEVEVEEEVDVTPRTPPPVEERAFMFGEDRARTKQDKEEPIHTAQEATPEEEAVNAALESTEKLAGSPPTEHAEEGKEIPSTHEDDLNEGQTQDRQGGGEAAMPPQTRTVRSLQKRIRRRPRYRGWILDDFPRTAPEARALHCFLAGLTGRSANVSDSYTSPYDKEFNLAPACLGRHVKVRPEPTLDVAFRIDASLQLVLARSIARRVDPETQTSFNIVSAPPQSECTFKRRLVEPVDPQNPSASLGAQCFSFDSGAEDLVGVLEEDGCRLVGIEDSAREPLTNVEMVLDDILAGKQNPGPVERRWDNLSHPDLPSFRDAEVARASCVPAPLARVVIGAWRNLEEHFCHVLRWTRRSERELQLRTLRYLRGVEDAFGRFVARESACAAACVQFQANFNARSDRDLRYSAAAKQELHLLVEECRHELWTAIESREQENQKLWESIRNDGFLQTQSQRLGSTAIIRMQAELNRLHSLIQILADYYHVAVAKSKLPPTASSADADGGKDKAKKGAKDKAGGASLSDAFSPVRARLSRLSLSSILEEAKSIPSSPAEEDAETQKAESKKKAKKPDKKKGKKRPGSPEDDGEELQGALHAQAAQSCNLEIDALLAAVSTISAEDAAEPAVESDEERSALVEELERCQNDWNLAKAAVEDHVSSSDAAPEDNEAEIASLQARLLAKDAALALASRALSEWDGKAAKSLEDENSLRSAISACMHVELENAKVRIGELAERAEKSEEEIAKWVQNVLAHMRGVMERHTTAEITAAEEFLRFCERAVQRSSFITHLHILEDSGTRLVRMQMKRMVPSDPPLPTPTIDPAGSMELKGSAIESTRNCLERIAKAEYGLVDNGSAKASVDWIATGLKRLLQQRSFLSSTCSFGVEGRKLRAWLSNHADVQTGEVEVAKILEELQVSDVFAQFVK